MNTIASYFSYDWWRDIWLPAAGAILIPLAIAFFTWFFGASRAERQKDLLKHKSSLNYLKSLCYYSIINLLTLREAIKIKYDICLRYNSASNDEKVLLFSPTVFQDVYSHIKIEKFSEFTLILPSFIVEILKVKRSLKDVFDTLKLLNNEKEDIKDITSVPAHLIAFQKNLPCFLKKISFAITTILSVINDIETVREKMKLSDIMDFSFSENEQKQIIESQEDKY